MSDLQSLKNRIKNIKNTSKVTKAMKLIAANKLKKVIKDLENSQAIEKVFDSLIHIFSDNDSLEKLPNNYRRLFKKCDNPSSVMFIVISSNKGLCGSFNSSLFKTVENELTLLLRTECDISIMTIGNKANNYFKNHSQELLSESHSNIQKFEIETANLATDIALQKFIKGEIDECRIYHNQYVSTISHPPKCQLFLPIEVKKRPYNDLPSYEGEDILEKIVVKYLYSKMAQALLENKSGEEAARMTSMESATNNAIKICDQLVLQYNRTRQSCITNEISEIISGSEAL